MRKEEYAAAQAKYQNGSMSEAEFYSISLQAQSIPEQEQALEQYEQDLQALKAMDNGYILPHWVYAELFGIADNTGSILQAVSVIAVALLCVLYASTEGSTGMTKARRATPGGRSKALIARYGAGIVFSALISLLIWALQIWLLRDSYGALPFLNAPICCLHYFENIPQSVTIIGYWGLLTAGRTALMSALSVGLLWITDRVQK